MKTSSNFKTNPLFLVILALGSLALSPIVQAVNPPPDGCYPNFTTAEGCDALHSLTSGAGNTAIGWRSLFLNSSGSFNTAVGGGALILNNGDSNTATGAAALLLNTTGSNNTANGTDALVFNDTGSDNTAVGAFALQNNTDGVFNTANGAFALFSNTTGAGNTSNGSEALQNNTTGNSNTATGFHALFQNTTGGINTAVGTHALSNNTTGAFNIAVGDNAGSNVTTANNVICIGHPGASVDNGCFIGNIRGAQVGNDALPVIIDSFGKLGTQVSSRRFKKDIQPMEKASETILALKPVTFHYKSDAAGAGPQFDLIAEDVAEVNPDLVVRDEAGEIYTVRYEAVKAMLLNEFLKAHKRVQDLEDRDAQQERQIESLTTQLREQATQLQKVSARIETKQAATSVALNRP